MNMSNLLGRGSGILLALVLALPGHAQLTDRLTGISTSLAIKAPVKAVTNAAITLSGEQTVNGVAVVEGDRVLVTEQADAGDNGIYVVDTSAWERAADFDGNRDVANGTLVTVTRTVGQSIIYQVDTTDPIVIGTSDIEFVPLNNPDITFDLSAAEIAAGLDENDIVDGFEHGHVERYGAVCNDSTNDYTAIANALLQSAEEGGSPTVFPRGKVCFVGANTLVIADGSTLDISGSGLRTTDESAITFGSTSTLLGYDGASIESSGASGAALKKTNTASPNAFYVFGWPSLLATSTGTAGSIGLDITAAYKGVFEISIEGYETLLKAGAGAATPQTYYNEIRSPRLVGTDGTEGIVLLEGANSTTIINPQINGSSDLTYLIRANGVSALTIIGGYIEAPEDANGTRGIMIEGASSGVTVIGTTVEIATSANTNYAIGGDDTATNVLFHGMQAAGGWGNSAKIMDWQSSGLYSFIGGAPTNQVLHLGQTTFPASETDGTARIDKLFATAISASVATAAGTAHTIANSGDGVGVEISNNSSGVGSNRAALVLNRKGGAGVLIDGQNNGAAAVSISFGAGSPEGVVTASPGSIYLNTSGGTDTTVYTKGSGTGNTGWVALDNV